MTAALSVLLALLAALGNSAASVLQRRAAQQQAADTSGAKGAWDLLRRPVWVAGMASLVLSGVCQGAALALGSLAVVQPVMATELLFTLVVAALVFRGRPDARTWISFLALAAGLGAFLAAAAPTPGIDSARGGHWVGAAVAGAGLLVLLVAVAGRFSGPPRATLLGAATAVCFAFTAALMKEAVVHIGDGAAAFFSAWALWGAVVVGLFSVLLLQVTLRAGTLVASQPSLTLIDSLLGVVLGVVLYEERVHLGWLVVPELLGLALMAFGSVELARSPLVAGDRARRQGLDVEVPDAPGPGGKRKDEDGGG